jgi:hypothetical protein
MIFCFFHRQSVLTACTYYFDIIISSIHWPTKDGVYQVFSLSTTRRKRQQRFVTQKLHYGNRAKNIKSKLEQSLAPQAMEPSRLSSDDSAVTHNSDERLDQKEATNGPRALEYPSPSLWCCMTRRTHIELAYWNIWRYPACGEELDRPKPSDSPKTEERNALLPSSPKDRSYCTSPLSVHDYDSLSLVDYDPPPSWLLSPLPDNTDAEMLTLTQFEYKIRYLDHSGGVLQTDAWPGPFNLEEARGKSACTSKNTILTIVILLQTDVPGLDDHRTRRRPISP